jgi:hypothetical protein
VWNIERVYEEPYAEGPGSIHGQQTIGQVFANTLVTKTLTQRLKSRFELVETRCSDAAKRLQEDPEMKEMINAMDPVVRRFSR